MYNVSRTSAEDRLIAGNGETVGMATVYPDSVRLEMSIVTRPYLLDFASAYLDWPPDFSPEVLEEWSRRKAKEFGQHWSKVQLILAILGDQYGVFLTDIHRGNIAFDSDDSEECQTSS